MENQKKNEEEWSEVCVRVFWVLCVCVCVFFSFNKEKGTCVICFLFTNDYSSLPIFLYKTTPKFYFLSLLLYSIINLLTKFSKFLIYNYNPHLNFWGVTILSPLNKFRPRNWKKLTYNSNPKQQILSHTTITISESSCNTSY